MKVAMLPRSGMCCEGGTAKYLQDLLPGLHQAGHELTIYTTGLNAERQERYPHYDHVVIPGGHLSLTERLITAERHVKHACEQDFDILHLHYPSTTFFMEEMHKAGKKVVVTHHGSQFIRHATDDPVARALYIAYKRNLQEADAVVVHSPLFFESYRAEGVRNLFYVPMGVALPEKELPLPPGLPLDPEGYMLFMGKFRKEKGLDLAIEAHKLLDTTAPLVVIGNEGFEPEYAAACRKSAQGRADILFLGEKLCTERDSLVANARFYVNPLRIQGLPLGVLEAAAAGRGIINSDNSSHHGVIADCTGHFEAGNAASLASAMRFFLDNPFLVQQLGKKAQDYVRQNHSIDAVVKLYDHIYTIL